MAVVGALVFQIGADLTELRRNVLKASDTLDGLDKLARTAGKAIASAFSVGAIVSFTKHLGDTAGELVDLSNKTGASIENLQRWKFVAEQAGGTLENFTDASFKLGVNMQAGSQKARD